MEIDFNTCTAIDVIKRSALMHPSLFRDAMQARIKADSDYLALGHSPATERAISASKQAAFFAWACIENDGIDELSGKMGAGIIALNIACKLQCIPAHIRTAIAIRTWP